MTSRRGSAYSRHFATGTRAELAPQRRDDGRQFVHNVGAPLVGRAGAIGGDEVLLVLQRRFAAGVETIPHLVSDGSKVGERGASVVQFVGGAHKVHGFIAALLQALVGAALDNGRDAVAETFANLAQGLVAALVLGRIVQQCGDGFFFRSEGVDDDGCNAQQMTDIRDLRRLAMLRSVSLRRELQRFGELVRVDL